MTALELYRQGELNAAIKVLGDELRSNPLDTKRRTFLFELLCFAGNYDRAEKQLDLLADANNKTAAGALLYRSALHAERTRQELFRTQECPESRVLRTPLTGQCNGKAFREMRDADPRIGANLEVFIAGSYTWIPMQYMVHVEFEKPKALRDLLWATARVETSPAFRLQDLGEVLVPVLSPFSSQNEDAAVQLGRTTIWTEGPQGAEVPLGQRMMWVDGEEVPLLEIRSIEWDVADREPEEGTHAFA